MSDYFGVSTHLLERYRRACGIVRDAEAQIAKHVLAQLPFGKGDLVEHKFSGLQYRVKEVSCSMGMHSRVSVYIVGYRYYRTGRKAGTEARSWTHISASDVVKVPQEGAIDADV